MTPIDIHAEVNRLSADRPLRWVALGWRDLWRAPLQSIGHGVAFVLAGAAVAAIGWGRHDLLAGAFSGFLLVAPMLSAGLYEISRRLARGERPSLRDVAAVWIEGSASLVRLGLLLAALGTAWVGLSALIVAGIPHAGSAGGGVVEFIVEFVLSPNWQPFALWLAVGGVFAAIVFAISAVSVPMMLDREVPLRVAVLTSVRAVGRNPVVMALWAAIVMVLTVAAMITVLPLIVVAPLLGHATWHAYADTVDASDLPPRL